MTTYVKAKANTNIALIKYWGKKNKELFLPMNSSLSLTLDAFYTETSVAFTPNAEKDIFILNDTLQSMEETNKICRFLDLFRKQTSNTTPITVESKNFVPTAAGLASSASAFAALGGAMNKLMDLNLAASPLSTYIRQGSGSATRSVYGGFVEWQMGTTSEDSLAIPIDDASWDIGMITVAVNTGEKKLSSREGMERTVQTSAFYPAWKEAAKQDIANMKVAITQQDFQQLGEITEANCMKMHGTMLGATPPFTYWEPKTLAVLDKVYDLRRQGWSCYFTMDAGPNVKILCRLSEATRLKKILDNEFPENPVIVSKVGTGITIIDQH